MANYNLYHTIARSTKTCNRKYTINQYFIYFKLFIGLPIFYTLMIQLESISPLIITNRRVSNDSYIPTIDFSDFGTKCDKLPFLLLLSAFLNGTTKFGSAYLDKLLLWHSLLYFTSLSIL